MSNPFQVGLKFAGNLSYTSLITEYSQFQLKGQKPYPIY